MYILMNFILVKKSTVTNMHIIGNVMI